MATEVTSKTELQSISGDLASKISTLKSDMDSMKSVLDSAQDYDGINVTGPAKILKSNLDIIIQDMESVSTNITNYANAIAEFDMDDFTETIFSQDIIKDAADENSPVVQLSNEQTTEVPTNNNGANATTLQWTNMSGQTGNTGTTYTGGSYSGGSYSGGSYSGGSYNSGSTGGSAAALGGMVAAGATGTLGDKEYGRWNPSEYVGDSRDINGSMTVTPSGKTSQSGRTQRSALKSFVIKPGKVDDPNIDISKYHNNIENGFEVTTGNLTYDLCEEDIELLCAIVAAESDKSYDDALAVVSTILNRCETSNWINAHGRDPIAQATAPNQYVVYQHGSYEKYMDGNVPDTVKEAVEDALAGVRNHNYTSFRSNGSTTYSDNMITDSGNRYL